MYDVFSSVVSLMKRTTHLSKGGAKVEVFKLGGVPYLGQSSTELYFSYIGQKLIALCL